MDDLRFDRLSRLLAQGATRRSLIKTALGIGSAATIATNSGGNASAARRTSGAPTPTTIACPGQQTPCGNACCCPAGNSKCGPDCCPNGQAVCCGNACCYGQCIGEEICCPSTSILCNGVCLDPGQCCQDTDCPPGQQCNANECVPACLPDGSSGCNTNDACCSGICQGGLCETTVAGSCLTGVAPCANPQTPCGQSVTDGCMCVIVDGQPICAGAATCAPDCSHCQQGDSCFLDALCCDVGVQCVTPCGPFGGSY